MTILSLKMTEKEQRSSQLTYRLSFACLDTDVYIEILYMNLLQFQQGLEYNIDREG